jgi:hypothetical protein
VVGVLYASVTDRDTVWRPSADKKKKEIIGYVSLPTLISHVVPGHYLANFFEKVEKDPRLVPPEDALTIEEMLKVRTGVIKKRGESWYKEVQD